jgi:hypothetical protein
MSDFQPAAPQYLPVSSASRFTAGAAGFLNLSQSGERPGFRPAVARAEPNRALRVLVTKTPPLATNRCGGWRTDDD